MDHDAIRSRLGAYMDGELGPEDRAAIELHLASCPSCAATLHEFHAVSSLVREMPAASIPSPMLQRLHARIDASNRRPVERFVGFLSGIAACLALAGGLMLLQPATAATVPAHWEGAVVGIPDETSSTNPADSRETALGQWIVSNLSSRGN